MQKVDFTKVLGFDTVTAEFAARFDFQSQTISDKPGAKVGLEDTGITLFQDETLAAKLGAKVGETEPESDVRLKRDIYRLATRSDGLPIYAFKYLWNDEVHVGVMAQDLLRNELWRPAVLIKSNGYFAVNYGLLGLRMSTLDDWRLKGATALERVGDD